MLRFLGITAMIVLLGVSQARADDPPTKSDICTGSGSGNYYWAAHQIIPFLPKQMFTGEVHKTDGTLDNINKLIDGTCGLAFGQSDVRSQFLVDTPALKDSIVVLAKVYTEITHVLCPAVSGWKSLTDMLKAKGEKHMIVGQPGSGTAETWRIWKQVDLAQYSSISLDPSPADFASAHDVAKSRNTCMLWISGLNSGDMVSTNDLSGKGKGGQPTLRLLDIDDRRLLEIKGIDGTPLYTEKTITPHGPEKGQPGLYDHLINNGGWMSSASITVMAIPAELLASSKYKAGLPRARLTKLLQAVDDAQTGIWQKVDPEQK
jgi:hypothetical protein